MPPSSSIPTATGWRPIAASRPEAVAAELMLGRQVVCRPFAARDRLADAKLEAEGAAFRSRKQWYGLRFRCEMAANGKVAGFQFRVGE
ncbi:MAG: DUF930 domain-containing protein, partial [Hyphomicrobiales bacterium]